jgi:hypothetical protein
MVDALNGYLYAISNPLFYVDWSGLLSASAYEPSGVERSHWTGISSDGYWFIFKWGDYSPDHFILQQVAVKVKCWDAAKKMIIDLSIDYQEVFWTGKKGQRPKNDNHKWTSVESAPDGACKCTISKDFCARECARVIYTATAKPSSPKPRALKPSSPKPRALDISRQFRNFGVGGGAMLDRTQSGTITTPSRDPTKPKPNKETKTPKFRLSCGGQKGKAISYAETYTWLSGEKCCANAKPGTTGTKSKGKSYSEVP